MEEKLQEMMKCPENEMQILRHDLKHFKSDLKKKWKDCLYKENTFLTKHRNWLDDNIPLHSWASNTRPGRPEKEFIDLSDRSKRRKTQEIRENVSVEELTFAASISQRTSGNPAASKLILDATSTPTRARKYSKDIITAQEQLINKKKTPEEALNLFVEGDFTRRQWELLHEYSKTTFPCYTLMREAKKLCYPKEDAIKVTETSAEVILQDLLDHTAKKLCLYLDPVLKSCEEKELENLELISKWGCDGSHQTSYQQKFADNTDNTQDDSHIFQSSLVPLRLQSCVDNRIKVLWQNPTPSSTRFCRPIRIRFLHETNDVTKEEIKYIEDQAKNLVKTEISNATKIQHTLLPTMVDGKVCNAATGTSSTMRCYICGKTSKDFNDFEKTKLEDPQALRFGLSILHARIRLFETVLHLAYKLPIKKWQVRSSEEKDLVKENKQRIQKEFKERTGLVIDMPKPGFGNSNSGNTSRRFFADPDLATEITGINKDLIIKLRIILEAISSGHRVNAEKFNEFCKETAKLYVQHYDWHPMTPTLHKILVHGPTIINHAILPIGQLSEEAAEARNKHFRSYRLDFARKFSRSQCNRDVLNRLLLTSDPYISSNRKRKSNKSQPFLSETRELLEPEEPDHEEINELD